jgi:hypothetical protein
MTLAADGTCTVFGATCEFATLVATWVLVGGTLTSVWIQFLFTRRTLTADIFTRLNERWDSQAMRLRRKALAEALLAAKATDVPPHLVEDVIDFFEDLGVMVRKKWVDTDSVWGSFCTAIRHYWKACGETYVTDLRHRFRDSTYFNEFEFLTKKMDKAEIERRRTTKDEIALTSDNVRDFLQEEAKLN